MYVHRKNAQLEVKNELSLDIFCYPDKEQCVASLVQTEGEYKTY